MKLIRSATCCAGICVLIAVPTMTTCFTNINALMPMVRTHAKSKPLQKNHSELSERVSLRAAGRGNPWINIDNGRDLLTEYDDVQFNRLVTKGGARALSLTSADFDEDGVPDLIGGYGSDSGGTINLHRGNVDSIFPNSSEARQSKRNDQHPVPPFLSPALVFTVPEPPDFIAAGDFDGDSHWDVATAARGSNILYLLSGDGIGNLGEARKVELAGRVTAMVCGDINRRDGLVDLIVAVTGPQGNQALVFESPEGALRSEPESITLPAEAGALAIGQLDDECAFDLAIAAGSELMIIQGRDRRPSLDEKKRAEVTPRKVERIKLPSRCNAIVIGDFVRDYHSEISLLNEDGRIQLVSRKNQKWAVESLADGTFAATSQIVCARVSSLPYDNLVLVDAKDNQLHILIDSQPSETRDLQSASATLRPLTPVTLDVDDAPVAVLPMRLNGDALSDLVILKKGANPIAVALTAPMSTFVVRNTNDSGADSLRQAISDANNHAGADAISFSIPGVGVHTITPNSALLISSPVVIDGYTQSGSSPNTLQNADNAVILIELNGSSAPSDGLGLQANGGSTIRGLVMNRFPNNGLFLSSVSGNIIEGNFIGTNAAGTADLGNSGHGVDIGPGANNTVGGTVPAARNVISGNDNLGIQISGAGSTGNMVQGNFIGTNASGTTAIRNTSNGVLLQIAPNNTIGGPVAGARNVISGNNSNGVAILSSGSMGNLVQGNFIGTDANASAPLGNLADGVFLSGSTNNTIGGYVAAAVNVIAFNGTRGVHVSGGTGNSILRNSIYSNTALGIDLDPVGVTANDSCDSDTGANNLQNFPVLLSASTSNVVGMLNSGANRTFRVEIFANPACHSLGNGEGKTFLGAKTVTTNSGCNVTFGLTFLFTVAPGQIITATSTDPNGNTSEFSPCVQVTTGCPVTTANPGQSFAANGGAGLVRVIAATGCNWTARTSDLWITITSGSTGSGDGTIDYTVGVNPGPNTRTGTITVAESDYIIVQGFNFLDVPTTHTFYDEIGRLSARGVTMGCGGGNYCPNDPVTREQMAAFMMRAIGEFNPPTPPNQRFNDVPPSNQFYNFIDRLAALQITMGCTPDHLLYCPSDPVKRDQMAAFIMRGLGEFEPPTPLSQRYNDVPPSNAFYNFIDRLAVLNITLGCTPDHLMYCPNDSVTRGQMAAFLVRAFGL